MKEKDCQYFLNPFFLLRSWQPFSTSSLFSQKKGQGSGKGVIEIEDETLQTLYAHTDSNNIHSRTHTLTLRLLNLLHSIADYPLFLYLVIGIPFAFATPYILLYYGSVGFLTEFGTLCVIEVVATIWKQEPMYQYYKKIIERKW